MPQTVKTSDKDLVNALVTRQDEVISELDKLEVEILEAIESLNTSRREEAEAETSTDEDSNTIRMTYPDESVGDNRDQSSRAA